MNLPPEIARLLAWLDFQQAYRAEQRRQAAVAQADKEMARMNERKEAEMNIRKDRRNDKDAV